ncbi:hypothetical protein Sta7437_1234 [Stanieria cyanosphaera PCC 7437]|uniref:Uncharacterized protein n=1 Tax=Stanieria cyanosphaera (strain ATCC 29371 / PCC 7437) TaxID=111780 RepID=K9XRU6_STAC7|nr:SPOR domain-containing protein [Stanieria cyanosphaera]AFZ34804.1 hypothetical protein Sta7437_1234 [Stanieria cyanosphaera PCC 7437]
MNSSQPNHQNHNKASGLVHQPFPEHEINIFNPPKNNPNGCLTKSNSESVWQASTQLSSPLPNNWLDQKVNPWIISSLLIVLLTNVVSGLVIYFYQSNTETKLVQDQQVNSINSPNLAAEEFIDLNQTSLSNIVLPQAKKNNNVKTKSKLKEKIISPLAIPPTSIPNPLGMTSSIAPNYYYILSEYTGEESLALAQQKVANVSLVNFPQGVFIYLGAFAAKEQANQFVTQLKHEGMDAYIYPFE